MAKWSHKDINDAIQKVMEAQQPIQPPINPLIEQLKQQKPKEVVK